MRRAAWVARNKRSWPASGRAKLRSGARRRTAIERKAIAIAASFSPGYQAVPVLLTALFALGGSSLLVAERGTSADVHGVTILRDIGREGDPS